MGKESKSVFDGKVALVTGGASGIGKALVHELVFRGCEVIIADLQKELAETVAAEITSKGGKVEAVALDVTDSGAFDTLVSNIFHHKGRLDFLFNNAGIMFMGDTDLYSIDDWNFTVDVNLRGVINGVQAVYGPMIQQGFGHIINTASMSGLIPTAGSIGYTTTKHAVVGLSRALRAEAKEKGIAVSVFCPGVIRTPIMSGGKFGRDLLKLDKEKKSSFLNSIEKIKPMDPTLFAVAALDAVEQKRFYIILPRWNRILWWLDRISPRLGLKISELSFKKLKESYS